jgi:hypothetical protein
VLASDDELTAISPCIDVGIGSRRGRLNDDGRFSRRRLGSRSVDGGRRFVGGVVSRNPRVNDVPSAAGNVDERRPQAHGRQNVTQKLSVQRCRHSDSNPAFL